MAALPIYEGIVLRGLRLVAAEPGIRATKRTLSAGQRDAALAAGRGERFGGLGDELIEPRRRGRILDPAFIDEAVGDEHAVGKVRR